MRENYTLPRLYLPDDLAEGERLELPREQAHYLTRVIRKGEGDALCVFNGTNGEWRAVIEAVGKKTAQISIGAQLRAPKTSPNVTLLFAPVRKHPHPSPSSLAPKADSQKANAQNSAPCHRYIPSP